MNRKDLHKRRFTTSAAHIIDQVPSRACERGIDSGFTEQTAPMLALWSLLRWERKVGLVALEEMGVHLDYLAREVNRTLEATCELLEEQLGPAKTFPLPSGGTGMLFDYHAPLEPLLSACEAESRSMGHNWVGSEHVLLAIIQHAQSPLREVLESHRITYDAVRKAVLRLLS